MTLTRSPLAYEDLPPRPSTVQANAPSDFTERLATLRSEPGAWFAWSTYRPTYDWNDDGDPYPKNPARVSANRMRHQHSHRTIYLVAYRPFLEWRVREYESGDPTLHDPDSKEVHADLEVRWTVCPVCDHAAHLDPTDRRDAGASLDLLGCHHPDCTACPGPSLTLGHEPETPDPNTNPDPESPDPEETP